MKQYEKSTFMRFFILFLSAFIFMYVLLATLYYLQEYQRLSKELELASNMKYIECMRVQLDQNCTSTQKQTKPNMQEVYHDLRYLFLFVLLIFVPISIGLSLFSIRPVRRASEMIDHFIFSIVHDINTPLTTILLNVKSLIKKSELASKKLQYILSSSHQLLGMQHDLLALVDENTDVVREEVVLKTMIEEIVETFKLQDEKQVFELQLEEYMILVNRTDIHRILQNLLSNAVKYNRNNHPIKIEMKERKIIIEDKGIGMKNAKRAFEQHYRENYNIKGNGLGLASVKSMTQRNGIDIAIQSQINKGTTIVLSFHQTFLSYS